MNDEVKKKISLIDELMIEDINNLSISELEENISALKIIIDKYFKKYFVFIMLFCKGEVLRKFLFF